MGQKTPFYAQHVALGAKIVDFGGWDMPLHYGSQVDEHHAVRRGAGLFDVAHMNVVDVNGAGARAFLRHLLANDVARLDRPGRALYSCMLNEAGGVIDDLIVYFLADDRYRVVLNAATRDKDLAWLEEQRAAFDVSIAAQTDTAMLAVQGPQAREKTASLLPDRLAEAAMALSAFSATEHDAWFVGRTGYTGEDGFEIVAPPDALTALWDKLVDAGVAPAGLGARDTLRLEAGMHLYGNDLDEGTSPLESGLAWTVALQDETRRFIGRDALDAQLAAGDLRRFTGLLLEDRGVLRDGQRVLVEHAGEGVITSGGYSPTLERSIAMARLPAGDMERVTVEVRNRQLAARVVGLPFVRHGKARIAL